MGKCASHMIFDFLEASKTLQYLKECKEPESKNNPTKSKIFSTPLRIYTTK